MQKILTAVYGEKAAEVLKETFDKLTDEQKYDLVTDVMEVLEDAIKTFGLPKPSKDTEEAFLKSSFDRAVELMPSLRDRLEQELKESLCESVELTRE